MADRRLRDDRRRVSDTGGGAPPGLVQAAGETGASRIRDDRDIFCRAHADRALDGAGTNTGTIRVGPSLGAPSRDGGCGVAGVVSVAPLRHRQAWLAWAACGARLVALVLNFTFSPNLNYQTITSVKQVALFGGEHVSSAVGEVSRLVLIGQLSNLLLLLYILDVTVRLWRRGGDNDRRRAAVVGGSLLFFVLAAGVGIALVMAGILALPFFLSFPFLMMVLAMSYELSLDVVRAGQLSVDVHRLAAIVASSDDAILGKKSGRHDHHLERGGRKDVWLLGGRSDWPARVDAGSG